MKNERYSLNSNLFEGMTDGKAKKVVRDRGGEVESCTYESRRDLDDIWYGIHEDPTKVLPDGRTVHTPQFVSTPAANPVAL
jgi:hypothetical protein